MIIWKGLGFLVLVIAFFSMFAAQLISNNFFGNGYYQAQTWPKLAGMTTGALGIWFVGKYLNTRPARTFIDKHSGREIVFRRTHDLFFIPMQWWAVILIGVGLFLTFHKR